jgi:guanylate kinase
LQRSVGIDVVKHPEERLALFNVSGPYGVGKDTILDAILSRYSSRVRRLSALTTRQTTCNDADKFYESVSRPEFAARVSRGHWLITNQLSGTQSYALSIDAIERAISASFVCVQQIFPGPQGAGRLRQVFGRRLFSIGLLPNGSTIETQVAVLRERLTLRGRESPVDIEIRLRHQAATIAYIERNPYIDTPSGTMRVFDTVVTNDELSTTLERVCHLFEGAFNSNGT